MTIFDDQNFIEFKNNFYSSIRNHELIQKLNDLIHYDSYQGYKQYAEYCGLKQYSAKNISEFKNIKNDIIRNYPEYRNQYQDKTFFETITNYKYSQEDVDDFIKSLLFACYNAKNFLQENNKLYLERAEYNKFLKNLKDHRKRLLNSGKQYQMAKNYIKKHKPFFQYALKEKFYLEHKTIEGKLNKPVLIQIDDILNSLDNGIDLYMEILEIFNLPLNQKIIGIKPLSMAVHGNIMWKKEDLGCDNHNFLPSAQTMLIYELEFYFRCWTYPALTGLTFYSTVFRGFNEEYYLAELSPYNINPYTMPKYGEPKRDIISQLLKATLGTRDHDYDTKPFTSQYIKDTMKDFLKNSASLYLTTWHQ